MVFKKLTAVPAKRSQAGISLIEVIASLAIMSIAFIGFYQVIDKQTQSTRVTAVAQQIKTTAEAMQAYINDNQATILASATSTTPYYIPISTLVSGNYLPANNSATTSYGQTMCGLVLNNSGKLFGILASEGGTALNDVDLSNLASQIGSAGGGVYTNPVVGSGVRGTQGQWSLALPTNFANANTAAKKCDGTSGAVTLTAGRPVVALWQGIGLNNQDLLYRKSVNGQPQLNQMSTPLGLWVDSVGTTVVQSAACTVNGSMAADSTGKPFICQNLMWSAVNSSTTAYWKQPVANYASLPASGNSVGDGRITTDTYRGYSWNGSSWVALAVDQNGNLTMSGNLTANTLIPTATVTQGTACSPNGAIAKDSTGLTLSCQSGVWSGDGFGYGQSWQYPSRSENIWYSNATVRPIEISISTINDGANNESAAAYVNNRLIAFPGMSPSQRRLNMNFTVPPGGNYLVSVSHYGWHTIETWAELR